MAPKKPETTDAEDRDAILRRRGSFVTAALATVASGALLSAACSAQPCLQCPVDGCSGPTFPIDRPDADAGPDAGPDASDAATMDASAGDASVDPDAAPTDAGDAGDAAGD